MATLTFILTLEVGEEDVSRENIQAIADAALDAAHDAADYNNVNRGGPEVLDGEIRYAGRN
jgi:hypothetical protein